MACRTSRLFYNYWIELYSKFYQIWRSVELTTNACRQPAFNFDNLILNPWAHITAGEHCAEGLGLFAWLPEQRQPAPSAEFVFSELSLSTACIVIHASVSPNSSVQGRYLVQLPKVFLNSNLSIRGWQGNIPDVNFSNIYTLPFTDKEEP